MDDRARSGWFDRGLPGAVPRAARPSPAPDDAVAAEIRRLRFADPEVEAGFRADYHRKALVPVRQFLLIAGTLYAALGLFDGGEAGPGAAPPVGESLRRLICPMAVGFLLVSYTRLFARLMEPAIALFGMVTCGGLAMLSASAHPAIAHPHFALLMAAAMFSNQVLKLRHRAAAAVTASTLLAFPASALAAGVEGPWPVALGALFLAIPALFGLLMSYSAERGARAEFLQRRIIHERTEGLGRALREVQARRLEAEVASRVDPLTELFNRRHFFSVAEGRRGPDAPGPGPVAVIILDVDHFKAVNDTHGHAVGDQVLQAVAARIRAGVRPGDVACRYGGEEFAVLLPGADLLVAATIGERLRAAIASEPVATDKGPLTVSVSAGIAASAQGQAPVDLLVDRADQALYRAKHGGRNNVQLWKPEPSLAAI